MFTAYVVGFFVVLLFLSLGLGATSDGKKTDISGADLFLVGFAAAVWPVTITVLAGFMAGAKWLKA